MWTESQLAKYRASFAELVYIRFPLWSGIFFSVPGERKCGHIKIDVRERAELTEEQLDRTIREETEMKEVEIEASTKEEQIVRLEVDMCS